MKAMIFAAGFGTRLQPLTQTTPKALVEIGGTPILDLVIRHLQQQGISEMVVNTHYLHQKIADFIKSQPYQHQITVSYEPKILGTGAGLYQARAFLNATEILVCNVDILCDLKIAELRQTHQTSQAIATLAINDIQADSMLLVDEMGRFCGRQLKTERTFYCRPQGKVTAKGFCGIQMITPRFFEKIQAPGGFSIIDDYTALLEQGEIIQTHDIGSSYWVDIGTLETLSRVNAELPEFLKPLRKTPACEHHTMSIYHDRPIPAVQ